MQMSIWVLRSSIRNPICKTNPQESIYQTRPASILQDLSTRQFIHSNHIANSMDVAIQGLNSSHLSSLKFIKFLLKYIRVTGVRWPSLSGKDGKVSPPIITSKIEIEPRKNSGKSKANLLRALFIQISPNLPQAIRRKIRMCITNCIRRPKSEWSIKCWLRRANFKRSNSRWRIICRGNRVPRNGRF